MHLKNTKLDANHNLEMAKKDYLHKKPDLSSFRMKTKHATHFETIFYSWANAFNG